MVELRLKDGNIKKIEYLEAIKLIINDNATEIVKPGKTKIVNLESVKIKIQKGDSIYDCDIESAKDYIINHRGIEVEPKILDLEKLYEKYGISRLVIGQTRKPASRILDNTVTIIDNGWEETVSIEEAKRRIKANPTKVIEEVLPGQTPKINVAKLLREKPSIEKDTELIGRLMRKATKATQNADLLRQYQARPRYLNFMSYDEWESRGMTINEDEAMNEYRQWQKNIKFQISGMPESAIKYLETVPENQLQEELEKWNDREFRKGYLNEEEHDDFDEDYEDYEDETTGSSSKPKTKKKVDVSLEEKMMGRDSGKGKGESKGRNSYENADGGKQDIYYKKYLKYKAKYLKLKNQF